MILKTNNLYIDKQRQHIVKITRYVNQTISYEYIHGHDSLDWNYDFNFTKYFFPYPIKECPFYLKNNKA